MSNGKSSSILRSSLGVAGVTFTSRILGLVRVMLEARVLGGSSIASAWFFAFSIPNLFRRILGEGALGTALIPVITETEVREGEAAVRRDLGTVFGTLGCLLALIVIGISAVSYLLLATASRFNIAFLQTERIQLMLPLVILLMPYAFFICLFGVMGAVLNTCRQFILPAAGALLLNIFLIGGLAWGYWHRTANLQEFLQLQAVLVLISGAVQFLLMLFLLYRYGRLPSFSRQTFRNTKVIKELWRLVLPGLIGAGALQISFVVDRSLAMWLGPQAVPALNNVDRIVDLPIGIFAVSLGSVLMATISRSAANGELEEISENLNYCLRHVFFISIPMAVGIIFLWRPMLSLLCLGGNYTVDDLEATGSVAMFYGAGIPLFCTLKVILPAYYARKQMRLPLMASLTAIGINIVLNLILMFPLKQGGIALATVLSSLANNTILVIFLKRQGIRLNGRELTVSLLRCLFPAIAAGAVGIWCCNRLYPIVPPIFGRVETGAFFIAGLLFAVIYFAGTFILKSPEIRELKAMAGNRRNKTK